MSALNAFTEALCARQYDRAAELATAMTATIKEVAREIWTRWVPGPAPF